MTLSYFQELDVHRIALGCIYILADRAEVDFPGTTRAAPSEFVVVSRNAKAPLREGDSQFFPFQVPWDLWQNVVVPLLEGDEGRNLLVQWLGVDWRTLLRSWVVLIKLGVDPSLKGTTLATADVNQVVGEPILRGPLSEEMSLYPTVDPQLAWIEGHPRLEYPEVVDEPRGEGGEPS